MSNMFQTNRVQLDIYLKKYHDYLDLYASFNNGSTEGSATFEEFYWRLSYINKYDDEFALAQSGY